MDVETPISSPRHSTLNYLFSTPKVSTQSLPFATPTNSMTQKSWSYDCPPELKPNIGMHFETLEMGKKFYESYAKECGFDVRGDGEKKSKDGLILYKQMTCNREGFRRPNQKSNDKCKDVPSSGGDNQNRVRKITRVGCKAMIAFKRLSEGQYEVYRFSEEHTHPLATPVSKQFFKLNRNMTIGQKRFVFGNAKVNQGPTKSFRMWKEQVGYYTNVGATLDDFKNFYRDLRHYIKDIDAQLLIENLMRKREISSSFFFDFEQEDGVLTRVFWADAIARKNYALFGDALSFDATYGTNRYKLVFTPFTGVDHHKWCVTFAMGLIAKEDIPSFEWLFRTFLSAMDKCQPRCIVTNQDPAMKVAIKSIFGLSKHRYCVWHIMKKLSQNVRSDLRQDKEFNKRINDCAYSRVNGPLEFEKEWFSILDEYDLRKNEWLKLMYDKKEMWIPAYFMDLYMGGLMRTTSLSESENNFFSFFTNSFIRLLEFLMRYESAMDAQRHAQSKFNSDSNNSFLPLKTKLSIERHASSVYTHTMLKAFQNELVAACSSCEFHDMKREQNSEIYHINDLKREKIFEVVYIGTNAEVSCSCKMFLRVGMLCRHCLWVYKTKRLEELPTCYIMTRWTKDAMKKPIFMQGNLLEECARMDEKQRLLGVAWNEIYNCVGLAESNEEDLKEVIQMIQGFSQKLVAKKSAERPQTKAQEMEYFLGCTAPKEVTIGNPSTSNNKGSRKRIVAQKDISIDKQKKKLRQCKKCLQYMDHDSCNCTLNSAPSGGSRGE